MPRQVFTPLKNKSGMEVCITNFGGRIVSIMVPDKNGICRTLFWVSTALPTISMSPATSVLPSDVMQIVSIQGRFVLDGDTIQLPQNNFGHCLHGGPKGWQYQVYEANLD